MTNEIWVEYKEDGADMIRRFYRQKGETVEEFEDRVADEAEGLAAESNIEILDITKYA